MRLVFAGTPDVAVPSLEALVASRHEVVGVVTRPDARRGRGKSLSPSPVAARAAELGLPVLKPEHPRDPQFQDALRALAPDCCPVVAYGALLPTPVLDIPTYGWINLHFSLLPAYRGAAPVQSAILHGESETGAVTFLIVPALDAGPVCGEIRTPIGARETAGDLLTRLASSGAQLLVETMDRIEDGTAEFVEQPAEGGTYAAKIEVEDAHVDWGAPVDVIDRVVRACTPAPGAWTTLDGQKFRLHEVLPTDTPSTDPGRVDQEGRRLFVHTGTGRLELLRVQPAGKKAMEAAAWANGLHTDTIRFGR
ncbi:methionyl-tRNA formyltransferase [Raineyella antarctica]|uniref:Methionyl-tRNA formyltransferase n=1 Tax=Raineyella antarctica TaxID=1577474 RepID=A0A1G6HJ69_9ACTN|nr:methionyl-tRNA formyltransferase [Raineyella antarctica]SDB93965.1 methionyl-tRNA formyltransferase [Raineyella antarctica]